MAPNVSLESGRLETALAHWLSHESQRGVFVTDAHFRLVVWNQWMEIHSGRLSSDVIGCSLFDLYPEAATRGIREYYEGAVEGAVTVLSHAFHRFLLALPPTNQELGFAEMPQSAHIGPLSLDGSVLGTVTIIDDVSDRLATEHALRKQIEAQRRARATAEQALHAKDEFLSTLSHEMRTPLNAVLGWARILLDRQTLDHTLVQRALQVIERNATAQAKMIDDMLDMARIVSGKLRLEMKTVDFVSIVLAAVDVIMPSADARKIGVRTYLDPKTPLIVGDPDRLQQVIVNLLSNAVKFTDVGGVIDVRLEMSECEACLIVKDTGRGIDSVFLPHVFERFRQGDASSTRRHGGLGLGLALVRDLVELHGGSVSAESAGDGTGATFTVRLPTMAVTSVGTEGVRAAGPSPRALAGIRVLLIEDETDSRDLARTALTRFGAQVVAVSSSAEAVHVVLTASAETMPHVVVADIGLPAEDGYVFMQQLRALSRERGGRIPAVTVTGYSTQSDVDRALAAGFQLHLSKPVDPLALIDAVAKLSREAV
ncbi:MAG TPA: ATP-binding protein [Vicinamibacterales bacterium]|nr:ATP-binding protein [Vicinamibacterales bacterium]